MLTVGRRLCVKSTVLVAMWALCADRKAMLIAKALKAALSTPGVLLCLGSQLGDVSSVTAIGVWTRTVPPGLQSLRIKLGQRENVYPLALALPHP